MYRLFCTGQGEMAVYALKLIVTYTLFKSLVKDLLPYVIYPLDEYKI